MASCSSKSFTLSHSHPSKKQPPQNKPSPGCPNFEIWMNIWTLCQLSKFFDTIQYITTILDSMNDKRLMISKEIKRLKVELDVATENKSKSDKDFLQFTVVYDENSRKISQLTEQHLEDVTFVSNLENKRKRIQNLLIRTATVELPKTTFPTLPIPSTQNPSVPITIPISTICQSLLSLIVAFSISFKEMKFSHSAFDIETIISKQKKGNLQIDASDVRGDGACGIRAFLTSFFFVKFGIALPRDPEGMISLIAQVKMLFFELIQIIDSNPLNRDFIIGLLSNPDNGSKKSNIYEYFDMVVKPDYQFTNFDLRVLIILFNLSYPDLKQINVIRKTAVSTNGLEEQYQSFSKDGIVEPVSMKHINILYTGGHYKAIFHIVEGILPIIFSVDEPLDI
jgi:hypothetical protein